MRILLISVLLLAAGGCANPESEAPIALQPGLYTLAIQSKGPVSPFAGPSSKKEKEICLLADHAGAFKQTPLKSIIPSSSACETKPDERHGNAFSGTRVCSSRIEDDMSINAELRYDGSHGVDRFVIDGSLKMSAPGQQPGQSSYSGTFNVQGIRTTDC